MLDIHPLNTQRKIIAPLSNPPTIRAELIGSDRAEAASITAGSSAPVLALCRSLIAAGLDPDAALEVYRRGVLTLRVRSLGAGAALTVREDRGTPEFARYKAMSLDAVRSRTAIEPEAATRHRQAAEAAQ
jgi:hypothetical protein